VIDLVIPHIFNQPGLKLARAAQYRLCRDADARMNAADMVLPLRQRLQMIFLAGQDIFDPPGQRAAQTFLNQIISQVRAISGS
jgi:hypothetical protein